ncbi:MAG: 3'(2'),5'-bisphosphate nucleotidase [Phycisphaeraceae bacterium]
MPQQLSRTDQLALAVDAVRAAARVTRRVQQTLITRDTLEKKDRSPVTVADFASQAVVCRALGDALVVGEEDAAELRRADNEALRNSVVEHVRSEIGDAGESDVLDWIDRGGAPADPQTTYWTLDPIDGTKGFLRREQYAIALGLIERGEIVLGVLGCPALDERGALLIAARGEGALQLPLEGQGLDDAQPVRVSDVSDPAQARFCESVESGHSDQSASAQIAKQLGITHEPVRMDSQAKYAAVARGDAQIYLRLPTSAEYRENIWDHAAGALVVAEAGGRVTDITGAPLDFAQGKRLERNAGIIATNGPLHERVIEAVRAVVGG